MPVSTVMSGGIGHARVHEGLEAAEALAAPDLHRADLGDARTVAGTRRWSRGRSRQNVTACSGVPEVVEAALDGGTRARRARRAFAATDPSARETALRLGRRPAIGCPAWRRRRVIAARRAGT